MNEANKKDRLNGLPVASLEKNRGGERGIRTLAPLTQSNPLAEGPLEPLGYLSKSGSPNRTRTCDNSINSRVLYQLSYQGKVKVTSNNLSRFNFIVKLYHD
jgi:hypothetical protein